MVSRETGKRPVSRRPVRGKACRKSRSVWTAMPRSSPSSAAGTSISGRFAMPSASRSWPVTARFASRARAIASSRRGRSSRGSRSLFRARRAVLSGDVTDMIEKITCAGDPRPAGVARDPRGQPGRPAALRRAGPLPEGPAARTSWSSASGPAGTGKTYLAVAMAVSALAEGADQEDRAGPAGRRGRRASRVPARATSRPRSTPISVRCSTRSTT